MVKFPVSDLLELERIVYAGVGRRWIKVSSTGGGRCKLFQGDPRDDESGM